MLKTMLSALPLATAAYAQKGWEKEWNETLAAAETEGRVSVAGSPVPVMRNDVIPNLFPVRNSSRIHCRARESIYCRSSNRALCRHLFRGHFYDRSGQHGQYALSGKSYPSFTPVDDSSGGLTYRSGKQESRGLLIPSKDLCSGSFVPCPGFSSIMPIT